MSVLVTTKVWSWSTAEGNQRLVMLALADFCDDDGWCYPGVARIAKKCRLSERTVQRLIRECKDAGELVIEQGRGVEVKGHGFTNGYRLLLTPPRGDSTTPRDDRGDKTGTVGVTIPAKRGDTAMSPESSVEPSVQTSRRSNKLTDEQFIEELKINPAYRHADFDRELGKMAAWLLTPRGRGRKLTRGFVLNWLNKLDAPMSIGGKAEPKRDVPQAFRGWLTDRYPDKADDIAKMLTTDLIPTGLRGDWDQWRK